MAQQNRCPHCNTDLPPDAPRGVCPRCLMAAGLPANVNAPLDKPPLIEGPGTTIGRYELLDLIGEGGMGLVYLAEQKEPIQRRVALKIVKLGMDTRQVVARFRAEQQTLALLDHPSIAKVLDAGTTESGRPYFVMEYVEGTSITKYCDEHQLSIAERLELFKQVCEGVHHAHQKGIIHRDLKPSNILVSTQRNRHLPKIIDFGVAKALTEPLADTTCFTREGQLLGTPEYMSPEQVDLATQDIDIRSDIYSLGVLLYELLAGVLPFDREAFKRSGFAEIQKTIREEEPATPSTRLTSLGEEAKEIAERRQTQLVTLARCLHRELEWIPMKAIRKDRTRRYRSASELADDIQNYLTGAPLLAGPESNVYRARKFVCKHAGSVATAALLLMVIVLGLVVSVIMGCRAEQARQQEASAREQVEQALARAENAERKAQDLAEDYRRALYFNRIALAHAAYKNNDAGRLCELLKVCPEDLRAWEWHYLDHISDNAYMTLQGNTGWTQAVSLDGQRIASGSSDNTIKVWDALTGAEIISLPGHDARVTAVAFSPDGRKITSTAYDGTIKVWEVASGVEVMAFAAHQGACGALFSTDGRFIVSGSTDKTIKLWDAATGHLLKTIQAHNHAGLNHDVSPDGRRIISCGMDTAVKVLDADTGNEVMVLTGHQEYINAAKYSPDGTRIVTGSWDTTLKLWDASTGDELMTMRGHEGQVLDAAFSPDGKYIASGSRDGTVRLWDASTGAALVTLRGHQGYVCSVVFSPEGKHIISGSRWDGTIKQWDIRSCMKPAQVPVEDGAWAIDISPDSQRILVGTRNGAIHVWNRSMTEEQMSLQGREGATIARTSFSPDGQRIVSCQEGMTAVWDAATGKTLMSLDGHEGTILAFFSPDNRQLVTVRVGPHWSYTEDTIQLRDPETGKTLKTLQGSRITCASFSPDGKRLVSGSTDGTITIWDTETREQTRQFPGHGGDIDVRFTPDGKYIVSRGPTITKLWDADTGTEYITLPEQVRGTYSMAFSPDGNRLVIGDRSGTVKLWNVATATEVLTLRERGKYGHSLMDLPVVDFSSDGNTIVIGGETGVMLLESDRPSLSDHLSPSAMVPGATQ